MSWKIQSAFAWKPIEVDVMDINFKKTRTERVWLVNYYIEVGDEKEKILNDGKPYTLEWVLKNATLFNLFKWFNLI